MAAPAKEMLLCWSRKKISKGCRRAKSLYQLAFGSNEEGKESSFKARPKQ